MNAFRETVVLNQKDCYCGIISLYDNVLRKLGEEPSEDVIYDPRKIYCSINVMDEVERYYRSLKPDMPLNYFKEGFAMHWVNSGPKASEEFNSPDPIKYIVVVEAGWASRKEEEEEEEKE